MKYQKLTVEIDRCKATAQAFLNYKRGDCTFDDFVMFAMEQNKGGVGRNDEYARDFFESLRDRTMEGSNSAINGLMDYDAIFSAVIEPYGPDPILEAEIDMIWSHGSRYFTQAKATLVA